MNNNIEARVAAGIALLNERRPDWREYVDADILDMQDRSYCVIGQAFDVSRLEDECYKEYVAATRSLGVEGHEADYGFDLTGEQYNGWEPVAYGLAWVELDQAWKAALTPQHVDYPHEPGTLYDCGPCEDIMREEIDFAEAGEL